MVFLSLWYQVKWGQSLFYSASLCLSRESRLTSIWPFFFAVAVINSHRLLCNSSTMVAYSCKCRTPYETRNSDDFFKFIGGIQDWLQQNKFWTIMNLESWLPFSESFSGILLDFHWTIQALTFLLYIWGTSVIQWRNWQNHEGSSAQISCNLILIAVSCFVLIKSSYKNQSFAS